MNDLVIRSQYYAELGTTEIPSVEAQFQEDAARYKITWYCNWIKDKVFSTVKQMAKILYNLGMDSWKYDDFCVKVNTEVLFGDIIFIIANRDYIYRSDDDTIQRLEEFGRRWPQIQEQFVADIEKKFTSLG